MNYLMFIIFILLTACSSGPIKPIHKAESKKAPEIVPLPTHEIREIQISPGKIFLFQEQMVTGQDLPELFCDQKFIPSFVDDNDFLNAYIAESYHSKRSGYECHFKYKNDYIVKVMKVKVVPFDYPAEYLTVDKKRVSLSAKNIKRWQKEMKHLKKVYADSIKMRPLFNENFMMPLKTKITTYYGSKRLFNKIRKSWHSGMDFRAAVGTPIPTSNSGKVVFTGDLFFNGNTVIVDHGVGILTLYCHLSAIHVSEGDFVKRGDIVGLGGKTGRVTGPHLHWGVRIHGQWVDGMKLVSEDSSRK